jgi:hypothetical protein
MSAMIAHKRSFIAQLGFFPRNFSNFPFKFNRFSSLELEAVAFSTPSAFKDSISIPLF